jgi:MFS family permease
VWQQDEAHLAEELPAVAVGKSGTQTFPPHSINLLILEPAPSAPLAAVGGLGSGIDCSRLVGLSRLEITMTDDTAFEAEIERHYRYNFTVNALDGTFFWFGASFMATRTILPLFVSHLTDSTLLLGLLATISAGGWLLPQLFTANRVQRLPRKKVLPVYVGFFSERVPIFLLVPTAWIASRAPTVALVVFLILFAWHVLGAGVVAVAWQDMIAKIMPLDRRGKFFGLTNFGGTGAGVLGAAAAAWLLDRYGFPEGYVLCFAAASVLIFVSWVFLALTREPAQANRVETVSQIEYWRRLPSVVRADQNFARFLLCQAVMALSGMAGGFVAVYAVQRWHLPDAQAGSFTAVMLIGQALANLIFGPLADRKGHKLVLELGLVLAALSIGLAAVAPAPEWFFVVFALSGSSLAGFFLSGIMIAFEFSTPDLRPTYIGLNNTISGVASSLAPLLGGWLASVMGYRLLFAVAFVIGLIGLGLLHWSVREPRHATAAVKVGM